MATFNEFMYIVGTGDYDVASIPHILKSTSGRNDDFQKAMCLLKLCADKGLKCTVKDIKAIVSVPSETRLEFWKLACLALETGMLSPADIDALVDRALSSRYLYGDELNFFALTGRVADIEDSRFLSYGEFVKFRDAVPVREYDHGHALALYRRLDVDCSAKCGKVLAALRAKEIAPTWSNAREIADSFVGVQVPVTWYHVTLDERSSMPFKLRVYEDFCRHGLPVWSGPGGVFGVPFNDREYHEALRIACKYDKPKLKWASTTYHASCLIARGMVVTVDALVEKFGSSAHTLVCDMYKHGFKTVPGELHQIDIIQEYMQVCVAAYRAGIAPDWERDHLRYLLEISVPEALSFLKQFYRAGLKPDVRHADFDIMSKEHLDSAMLMFMEAGLDYVAAGDAIRSLSVDTTEARSIIAFHEARQRRAIWHAYKVVYPDHASALVKKREVWATAPELPIEVFRLIASKLNEPVLMRVRFP
jgi:hypothetical protein